ncbi:MAG: hypothetical protein ACREFR_03920 [Limisphaerales bacterium]
MNAQKSASKRGWRIVRRALIALAILATLIGIFYTEEDWRGKRAWESYKRQMEAKGEKFDWRAFIPSVPDDSNFFKAPIFKRLSAKGWDMNTFDWKSDTNNAATLSMSIYGNSESWPRDGYWWKGTTMNLVGWQQYYRASAAKSKEFPAAPRPQSPAADVLLALSKYDSTIEELRKAGQRPDSWLPLDYDQGKDVTSAELLPWLAFFKRTTEVLELRSVAELQNGESEKALGDVELMFRLNNSIRNQPFLVTHLVRIAIFNITMQPVWEGLAQHRWTNDQLARLDDAFAKMDFLADYEFAMRGETAFAIETIENERMTRQISVVRDAGGETPKVITYHFGLTPSAYFYRSELAYAQISQQLVTLVNTNRHIVSPKSVQRALHEMGARSNHLSIYTAGAFMTARDLISAARRFAIPQTGLDLARVACALERYRLAHGEYPKKLEALSPQFIEAVPHDIINGKPLHYRLISNGKFLLYSVGWNETDDGGRFALYKNGNIDYSKGDWVWPNAAN